MCLTVPFHNLSPGPLWSSSWSGALYFIHHAVLSLFCCYVIYPNLSVSSLLGNLSFSIMPHIHLTILISARWSATSFSFLTGQVSLPCNIPLRAQWLYNLPLIINDMSMLVSSGTNCLNLFQPIRILASTAAWELTPSLTETWFCLSSTCARQESLTVSSRKPCTQKHCYQQFSWWFFYVMQS